jgi:hypothetical protein
MTFVEAVEEIVEVAAGVAPIDRSGSLLPGSLEGTGKCTRMRFGHAVWSR